MTGRDIAAVALYGLLFASVVVWAGRRPPEDRLPASHAPQRAYSSTQPLERSEGLPEMRRVVQHMIIR
jgi:hypothetical protein